MEVDKRIGHPMERRRILGALPALTLLSACGSWELLPIRTPDVPFVVTDEDVVVAMLKLAAVGPGDTVYDLGCGDGRIPITAASQFGARGVGVDLDAGLVKKATESARAAGVADRVEFRVEDLFQTDLRPATVVTVYLLPPMLERLEPTFRSQLRHGARIVSHQFTMGSIWPPDQTQSLGAATLFLWRL